MNPEEATPCRHAGAPPPEIVDKVSRLINELAGEADYLSRRGLTEAEFRRALPMAIEAIRGRVSANNAERREFLKGLFEAMLDKGLISAFTTPVSGKETVYRLSVGGRGEIAVIQKGCPDGHHSSVAWEVPKWADETYLWWLCSSMRYHPGEHVAKGVTRLRKRFFSERPGRLDGVIFHNELCGTPHRICPKISNSIDIGGQSVPPPCVYVMPDDDETEDGWNWKGNQVRVFPELLLSLFGITPEKASAFTGHIGFQQRPGTVKTIVTGRFGPFRSTTHRS
jgi:hypothetical protein